MNMKLRQLLRLSVLTACVSLFTANSFAGEITYNLYTANEHRVSPGVYEFDVYVQATGTESFRLRTVQNTYTFNPAFINGATVNVTYVAGSSQMPTFVSNLKWSNTGNGFTSTANVAGSCATNGINVPLAPASIKVATYRLTAVAGQFANTATKVDFVMPGKPNPASDLRLKSAVSRWDDNTCLKGTTSAVPFKAASTTTGITTATSSTMAPTLFPNPTAGKTTLAFNAAKADKYIVKVYDVTGQIVVTDAIAAAQGYNSKEFDLTGQAAGRYTISIQTSDTDKETLNLVIE
jgi:hypothetical protein